MESGGFSEQLKFLQELSSYIQGQSKELSKLTVVDRYESESTKEIATAFAIAQGEFPSIDVNQLNPYFKKGYADLDTILSTIRPILSKSGLCVTQQTRLNEDGTKVLHTRLRHVSGEWIESRSRIIPSKNDPHTNESELTYEKRNQLKSLLGLSISGDDDDAERAMYDQRETKSKGVAINAKYDPRDVTKETITKEQLNELEYELAEYPDIAEMVLDGLRIQSLADMPKSKFQVSATRIREIKRVRNEGDRKP
jgi:hypothetical protein